jgi:hypothetical protein
MGCAFGFALNELELSFAADVYRDVVDSQAFVSRSLFRQRERLAGEGRRAREPHFLVCARPGKRARPPVLRHVRWCGGLNAHGAARDCRRRRANCS